MSVSYKKLWIHLIEKNMKRTDLIKLTRITSNTAWIDETGNPAYALFLKG